MKGEELNEDPRLPRSPLKFEGTYDWMGHAACSTPDGEFAANFFPEKRDLEALAIRICGTCPVKKECGDYAVKIKVKHGIWGGKNYGGIKGRRPKSLLTIVD